MPDLYAMYYCIIIEGDSIFYFCSTVSPAMLMTQDVGLAGLSPGFDQTLGLMTPISEPHTFRRHPYPLHQHNNNSDNDNNNSKNNMTTSPSPSISITTTTTGGTPALGRMKTEHTIDNALGLFPDVDPHLHQQQLPQLHLPASFLHHPQPLLHACLPSSTPSLSPNPNSGSLSAANLYLPSSSPCHDHGVGGSNYPMTPISPSAQLSDPSGEMEMQRFVQQLSGMLPSTCSGGGDKLLQHTPLLPTLPVPHSHSFSLSNSYPSPIPTPPSSPPPPTSSPSLPTQLGLQLELAHPQNGRTARTAARSSAAKGTRTKRIAARTNTTSRAYKHRMRRNSLLSPAIVNAPPPPSRPSRTRTRHIPAPVPAHNFSLGLDPNLDLGDGDDDGDDDAMENVEIVREESRYGSEIVVFDAKSRTEKRKWKCRKCQTIVGRKPDLHRHYKSCVNMEKHFCKDVVSEYYFLSTFIFISRQSVSLTLC